MGAGDDERSFGSEDGGGFDEFTIFDGQCFFLPEDPIEGDGAIGHGSGIFQLQWKLRTGFEPDTEACLSFGGVFADEVEVAGGGGLAQGFFVAFYFA